jgi:hypothetical protein
MDLFEFNTQSFILKIWIEEIPEESRTPTWRGHITHVPTGERRYLKSLNDVANFVIPYMARMGVRPAPARRIGEWIEQWRKVLKR